MISKENSMVDALSYCSLKELPPEWDNENVYLKALALVKKVDGSESYVLIQKNRMGEDVIVKDFGSSAVVCEKKGIYPFIYMEAKWIPILRNKEEKVSWLVKFGEKEEEVSTLPSKKLDKLVLNVAMRNAIFAINKTLGYE